MTVIVTLKSFPDHKGIPGHQGGSLPANVSAPVRVILPRQSVNIASPERTFHYVLTSGMTVDEATGESEMQSIRHQIATWYTAQPTSELTTERWWMMMQGWGDQRTAMDEGDDTQHMLVSREPDNGKLTGLLQFHTVGKDDNQTLQINWLGTIQPTTGVILMHEVAKFAFDHNLKAITLDSSGTGAQFYTKLGMRSPGHTKNLHLYIWDEADIKRVAAYKEMPVLVTMKSFPGHVGIPGHQGGSLPRGDTTKLQEDIATLIKNIDNSSYADLPKLVKRGRALLKRNGYSITESPGYGDLRAEYTRMDLLDAYREIINTHVDDQQHIDIETLRTNAEDLKYIAKLSNDTMKGYLARYNKTREPYAQQMYMQASQVYNDAKDEADKAMKIYRNAIKVNKTKEKPVIVTIKR